MKLISLIGAAAAMCFGAPLAAACDNPPLPMIPAADEAEGMEQEVRMAVVEYYGAMQDFATCLQAAYDEAESAGAPQLARNLLVQRNNRAVAETEAVLQAFNAVAGELGWETGNVAAE